MSIVIKILFCLTGIVSYSLLFEQQITVYNITSYKLDIQLNTAKMESKTVDQIRPVRFPMQSGKYKITNVYRGYCIRQCILNALSTYYQ